MTEEELHFPATLLFRIVSIKCLKMRSRRKYLDRLQFPALSNSSILLTRIVLNVKNAKTRS